MLSISSISLIRRLNDRRRGNENRNCKSMSDDPVWPTLGYFACQSNALSNPSTGKDFWETCYRGWLYLTSVHCITIRISHRFDKATRDMFCSAHCALVVCEVGVKAKLSSWATQTPGERGGGNRQCHANQNAAKNCYF